MYHNWPRLLTLIAGSPKSLLSHLLACTRVSEGFGGRGPTVCEFHN